MPLASTFACGPPSAPLADGVAGAPPVGWASYAADAASTRWSPLDDIDRSNVHRLTEAWRWDAREEPHVARDTGERVEPGMFEATPIVFGDTLVVITPFNRVAALDARSGEELWRFDPEASDRGVIANDHGGFVHRGVASWEGPEGRRILFGSRTELLALDASTGRLVATFGDGGRVDLTVNLRWPVDPLHVGQTSPPAVWNDIVVVGSLVGDRIIHQRDPPGAVQAFDARSGRPLWLWDPVPSRGEAGYETWGDGSAERTGHVNVWAPMSVDAERGLLLLPVSAASNDWYGGLRPGDNLFSQSVVALDIRSGEMVWYRQLVHHDLWDYDLAAAPALVRMARPGAPADGNEPDSVDAALVVTKMGFLYGFDVDTGEPLWPVEERPVPASDVPGEVTSATQPYATRPAPFARQGFSRDDVLDFTPELRRQALERIEGYRTGPMFTPPSLDGTVVMPGWIGGAGWGALSVDPVRGVAVVKASNHPVLARLVPRQDETRYRIDRRSSPPYPVMITLQRKGFRWPWQDEDPLIPVIEPPYGTLTAIDLATGEHLWQVPAGDRPEVRTHPALRGVDIGQTGVHGAPGGLSTASGLVFLTGGGSVFFAHDIETGAVLWTSELEAEGYSNPMTYRATDGRQYVVLAVGGEGPAWLQAFALGVEE